MARFLAENEALLERGVVGERAPDGTFIRTVKLYEIVSIGEVNPKTGLTQSEETLCTDIAQVFAGKMKQYIDAGGLMPKAAKKGAKA